MTTEEQGQIEKLKHQFTRATKLADCIQDNLGSNRAEIEQAIKDRPDEDWWEQIAIVCGITKPSIITQALTLLLLDDRESKQVPKMKARVARKSGGGKNVKRIASGN